MLDSIHGRILGVSPTEVIVDLGSFAVCARVSTATLDGLRIGEAVRLHCHLRLREEELTLYGFARSAERDTFLTLLDVAGLGPEKALTLLSAHSPESIARAIEDGDAKKFKNVRGIGDKLAQRIVLELKGKLLALAAAATPSTATGSSKETLRDLVAALGQLGYPKSTAEAMAELAQRECGTEATLEVLVRSALRTAHSSSQ